MLRLSKRTFILLLTLVFIIVFGGIAIFVLNYIQNQNVSPNNPQAASGEVAIGTEGGIGARVANQGDYAKSVDLNPGQVLQVQVKRIIAGNNYTIGFYNLDNMFPSTGGNCQGTPRPAGIPESQKADRTSILGDGTQNDCSGSATFLKRIAKAPLESADINTHLSTFNYTFDYDQLCQIDANNNAKLKRLQLNMAYNTSDIGGNGSVVTYVNLVGCGSTVVNPVCDPTSDLNQCRVQFYTNSSNQRCFKIFGLNDCKVLNGRETDFRYIYQVNNPNVSTCPVGIGTNNGFVLDGQGGDIVEGMEYCAVDKGYTCTQADFNFKVRYSTDGNGAVTNCPNSGSLDAGGTCACGFNSQPTTPICDLAKCNSRAIQCFNSGNKVVKCDAQSDCQSSDPNCVNGHWATTNYTCNSSCDLVPVTTATATPTATAQTCSAVVLFHEPMVDVDPTTSFDMQCGQSLIFSMNPGTVTGLPATGENGINEGKWSQLSQDAKGTLYGQNTNYGGMLKFVANSGVTGSVNLSVANTQGSLTCGSKSFTINIACTTTPKVYPTGSISVTGGTCANRNVTFNLNNVVAGSGTLTDQSIVIINTDQNAFGNPVACPIALRQGTTYSGVGFYACDYTNTTNATWTPPTAGGTFKAFIRAKNSDNLTCNGNPLFTSTDRTSYDPDILNCSSQDSVTITIPSVASCTPTYPDLIIKKTADKQSVNPGATVTYKIQVQNIGDGATSGTITVTDQLPTNMVVSSVSGNGWNCTNAISCTTSVLLAKNQFAPDITVTATIGSNASGSLVNNASVSGGGEREVDKTGLNTPDSGNNSDNRDNYDKWTLTVTQSPVDGSCGAANGSTTGTCGQAPMGTLCASGNSDKSPILPTNGGSVSWKCVGLNGSTVTKDCSASCTRLSSSSSVTTTAKTITATVTTCGKDGCLPNTSSNNNITIVLMLIGGILVIGGYASYKYYTLREYNYKNRKDIFES